MFQRNAHELMQVLDAAEKDERLARELFQNVRPTNVRRDYFGLLDQKLHNMLASAVSLVDHTRRVRNKYKGTDFYKELMTRNNLVRAAPGSTFVRDLRNYLLHYGVLAFVHQISMPSEGSTLVSEVHLDCAQLRTWDGWTAPSKSYMTSRGETVHLSATVREYIANMESLYRWVFEQFEGLHGKDIDDTNKLVAELNLTMTGGVTDGRDWHARMAHMQENLRAWREGREQTAYVAPNNEQAASPIED